MNLNEIHNKKVFIAGSSGMVGGAIKRAFLKNKKFDSNKNFIILSPNRNELDLLNYNSVEIWLEKNKPDIVIIAAAKVGGIYANKSQPTEFILENLKIQTNLIELSYKHNVSKLLFLGSSCIYPKLANQPIMEEELLNGQLEPTNQYYALAKIAGLKLCEALGNQNKFNAICLMPTNLYGPGDNYHPMNSHVLPALIRKITDAKKQDLKSITCWGTGKPLREFLYVDDLADACIFALEKWSPNDLNAPIDKFGNKLYWLNVGSNSEISIRNLVEKIALFVGFKGKILWDSSKPDGTPRKILDTSRMRKLGWEPKIDLDQGIKLTLKSFEKEISLNKLRNI
jgi:GDP-L-fucose synthase